MRRDNIGREIYNKLGSEKIIVGIKDSNVKVKFMTTFIWAIPLVVTLGILLNLVNFYKILTETQMLIVLSIFIVAIISTITILGTQVFKLYIKDNFIIVENYFKMKKYIDINKYPRIYIRQHIYENYRDNNTGIFERGPITIEKYYLYLEQNKTLIKLDTNTNGVKELLDSLILKDRTECTQQEWNFSVSNREQKMSEYMKYLKQGRIIGVKDKNKNVIISKKQTTLCYILTIVLILLIVFEIFLLSEKAYGASIFILFGIILDIGALIVKINSNKIKISYIDDCIKINKYKLNYKENNIKLELIAMQLPVSKEKYEYSLQILGQKNKYTLSLGKAKENEIGEFIDNLILEGINN